MNLIEPHIHCVSRTTDDYLLMARAGIVGVSEPAFWAGFDRSCAASFHDYFHHLTDIEPKRAERYGIQHYSWLCINAKEADNVELSREVISLIPDFLDRPTVLGIGEIGLNKNTANEITIFEEQVDLAVKYGQMILIHTPHLVDKRKGTEIITSILKNDSRIEPSRVLIDHCEEHTIRLARENGFWAGLTTYPVSKVTPVRAVDLLEQFGPSMMMVNSAADWAESSPNTLLDTVIEYRRRGHDEKEARDVFYNNPCRFFGQSDRFKLKVER